MNILVKILVPFEGKMKNHIRFAVAFVNASSSKIENLEVKMEGCPN